MQAFFKYFYAWGQKNSTDQKITCTFAITKIVLYEKDR